jgi:signal transduction histidine kinase
LAAKVDVGVLTVDVADDGRGLPAGLTGDKPGYGLRAMRERAARIGATFQVMNQVSGGVLVRVALPLAGHEPDAEPAESGDRSGERPGEAAGTAASVATGTASG